ncbi:hypothetical protein thsps117_01120 [Pseudomonas sp. No.117]
MQVAVVEIVDVAVMLDGGVATLGAVLVAVIRVVLIAAGGHGADSGRMGVGDTAPLQSLKWVESQGRQSDFFEFVGSGTHLSAPTGS